ncbi:hypothetical protein QF002_000549 [Paraburkholderia youngii]
MRRSADGALLWRSILPARQSSAAQAGQQWHPDEMFVTLRGKR